MLKLIHKIEKSKTFWFLLIIFLVFFLLRLPSTLEPNWYGDEGIYQVIGRAINDGRTLYSGVWDNKPPLLYLTYALFNGDHFTVRFFSLIVGLLTTFLFFAFSQSIFKNLKTSIITTSVFTFLFATPLIEGNIANAENFMLLPIIGAAFLVYRFTNKHVSLTKRPTLFVAGLLLGIAFLFKIVALFDFAALFLFLIIVSLPDKLSWHSIKKNFLHMLLPSGFLLLGFLLPVIITFGYFTFAKALPDFIEAVFSGMFGYVGYRNSFIIPQGFLILKLLALGGIIYFLIAKRNILAQPTILILLWISFSLFNAFFSQRPYTHYLLVLVPSFCLLIGLVANAKGQKKQKQFLVILLVIIGIIFSTFRTYNIKKLLPYYQNAFLFMTSQKEVSSYQAFFDQKTPRDYALASYIKMHSKLNDPLFLWGDSAQIYTLSDTLPITKFTVAYHMRQSKKDFKATQEAINTIQPKYIILLPESANFPFRLDAYVSKFAVDGAVIYEKSF